MAGEAGGSGDPVDGVAEGEVGAGVAGLEPGGSALAEEVAVDAVGAEDERALGHGLDGRVADVVVHVAAGVVGDGAAGGVGAGDFVGGEVGAVAEDGAGAGDLVGVEAVDEALAAGALAAVGDVGLVLGDVDVDADLVLVGELGAGG